MNVLDTLCRVCINTLMTCHIQYTVSVLKKKSYSRKRDKIHPYKYFSTLVKVLNARGLKHVLKNTD